MTYRMFDWDKCRVWVAERSPVSVDAGLFEDWFLTGAEIYANGKFRDDHGGRQQGYNVTPIFIALMPNRDLILVHCYRSAMDEDIDKLVATSARNRAMTRME